MASEPYLLSAYVSQVKGSIPSCHHLASSRWEQMLKELIGSQVMMLGHDNI